MQRRSSLAGFFHSYFETFEKPLQVVFIGGKISTDDRERESGFGGVSGEVIWFYLGYWGSVVLWQVLLAKTFPTREVAAEFGTVALLLGFVGGLAFVCSAELGPTVGAELLLGERIKERTAPSGLSARRAGPERTSSDSPN